MLSLIPDFLFWFPILGIVVVFTLGSLVLFKDFRSILNRLFGFISAICILWLFGTVMMYWTNAIGRGDLTLFWDRSIYIGIAFIPSLEYHFGLAVARLKPNRLLYFSYILSSLFLLLSRTDVFLSGLFQYKWGVHAIAGLGHDLFLVFFFFYVFAFLQVLYAHYKRTENAKEKARVILVLVAFAILDLIGGLGFLPAYQIGIVPVSLIAPVIFSCIIGYSIVRYSFLDIKIFSAQASVIFILLLIGTRLFFARSIADFVMDLSVLLFSAITGIFLIKSAKEESQRKEELQRISDSLAKANERLRELDNTKTEFISIASHQLRTPLTAIKGYLSLLLEGSYGTLSAEITDVLEKLNLVNKNLIQLVEDLLNVSRIDAGRIKYSFELTQLELLVAERVDMFVPIARDRGIELGLRLPKMALPKMMIDPGKMREAISNLVDNSIKYTEKGSVIVSIEPVRDEAVRILVEDTGIGFREEDGAKLFGKFVRTQETTKVYVSGTGLGLFVGKSFVEAHGGRMWAESDGLGKGSRFYIELPVVNPKAPMENGSGKEEEK